MGGRLKEAEVLLRHCLTVLEFVEGENEREHLDRSTNELLADLLLDTDHTEEAEPQIRRLRELAAATTGTKDRMHQEVHWESPRVQGS